MALIIVGTLVILSICIYLVIKVFYLTKKVDEISQEQKLLLDGNLGLNEQFQKLEQNHQQVLQLAGQYKKIAKLFIDKKSREEKSNQELVKSEQD